MAVVLAHGWLVTRTLTLSARRSPAGTVVRSLVKALYPCIPSHAHNGASLSLVLLLRTRIGMRASSSSSSASACWSARVLQLSPGFKLRLGFHHTSAEWPGCCWTLPLFGTLLVPLSASSSLVVRCRCNGCASWYRGQVRTVVVTLRSFHLSLPQSVNIYRSILLSPLRLVELTRLTLQRQSYAHGCLGHSA